MHNYNNKKLFLIPFIVISLIILTTKVIANTNTDINSTIQLPTNTKQPIKKMKKTFSLEQNQTIEYMGEIIVLNTTPEEGCGEIGEYKYNNATTKYELLHYKYTKELEMLPSCKYHIKTLDNNNNNNNTKNSNNINYNKIIIENNPQELKNIFNDNITNSINITEEHNINNIHKLEEKRDSNVITLNNNQYISIINLNTQALYIYFYNQTSTTFEFVAKSLISSGNKNRGKKYFDTPIVTIDRTQVVNGDWLAEGTDSKGFGDKGNRIFWLGIQEGVHLAMHSTTPWGVENLGKKYSKGCIRMSPILNKILRETKVLDGIYGKYIIIDSY